MKIHTMEQMSSEWFAAKSGLPSASRAREIVTPTGAFSESSDKYLNQLLAERAGYGDPPMEPTEWMARGIELEPEARALFELETDLTDGLDLIEVGGVTDLEGTRWCSPDGLIQIHNDDMVSGLEIKCPKASTHFAYLRDGFLPSYYGPQVHASMAISKIDRWIFMSYFPGLDPLIIPVVWDDYTEKVSKALDQFCERLAEESARFGL